MLNEKRNQKKPKQWKKVPLQVKESLVNRENVSSYCSVFLVT